MYELRSIEWILSQSEGKIGLLLPYPRCLNKYTWNFYFGVFILKNELEKLSHVGDNWVKLILRRRKIVFRLLWQSCANWLLSRMMKYGQICSELSGYHNIRRLCLNLISGWFIVRTRAGTGAPVKIMSCLLLITAGIICFKPPWETSTVWITINIFQLLCCLHTQSKAWYNWRNLNIWKFLFLDTWFFNIQISKKKNIR